LKKETRHATHEIIAGERRFVAARIAGLREVPVLMKDADNTAAVVMQLIENLHRENLNPLDEAHGIQLLVDDFELTRDAVADALKRSRTHVIESLRLLNICPEATAALKSGALNRSVALLVAQRPTPALQTEFTKKVLTGGPDGGPLSYRSAKDLAQRQYMTDLTQAACEHLLGELGMQGGRGALRHKQGHTAIERARLEGCSGLGADVEQAQAFDNVRAAALECIGHGIAGQLKVIHQQLDAVGLVQWVEVFSVQVLDELHDYRRCVVGVFHQHGHFAQACDARRHKAALARDDFMRSVARLFLQ
jgi:ParB/RepB/Spo0J family partition protein